MRETHRPVIAFLTDFGLDGAAATCRGVMLAICPDAQVIDVSHTVRKFAIRDGAFIFRSALPFMPVGVHLAVVDPGVGTARRPLAIATTRGDVLIGPDNGLLLPAAAALGGAESARELTNRELWLPQTTATFHGRDIFAPVAARLACGLTEFEAVGGAIDLDSLVALPAPTIRTADGRINTEVTYVDSFGNLRLAGGASELARAFGELADGALCSLVIGQQPALMAAFAASFGHVEVGAAVLYIDSSGDLAVGMNQGDLGASIGASPGMQVLIERP